MCIRDSLWYLVGTARPRTARVVVARPAVRCRSRVLSRIRATVSSPRVRERELALGIRVKHSRYLVHSDVACRLVRGERKEADEHRHGKFSHDGRRGGGVPRQSCLKRAAFRICVRGRLRGCAASEAAKPGAALTSLFCASLRQTQLTTGLRTWRSLADFSSRRARQRSALRRCAQAPSRS